jgi:hypothetical protein
VAPHRPPLVHWIITTIRDRTGGREGRLRAHQRPGTARYTGDGMKLHRRTMRLDGRDHTVLTLRPGTDARFSTNRYHGAWHVLSDWHGARVLARLFWGLAYQRVPRTLVVIDPPFLDPDPFDARPAAPIALVPMPLTALPERAARELRRQLPLRQPPPRQPPPRQSGQGTVRWNTRGLAGAVADFRAARELPSGARLDPWRPGPGFRERVQHHGGVLVLSATPEALRINAVLLATLGDWSWRGMDYLELDHPRGEVQVFADYRTRVSAARAARRELDPTGSAGDISRLVWQRAEEIRGARRAAVPRQRRTPALSPAGPSSGAAGSPRRS